MLSVAIATPPAHSQPPAKRYSAYDRVANERLAQMTLAEKVGQMTQAELTALGDLTDVRALALGSVLSGGNGDPQAGNSVDAWADAYDACQRQALATRLGIPILYGVDAVHGHSNVLGAVIFPHNIALGCTRDPELVEEVNRITALEMRATGVNWNFAPCVAVPRDDRWGRTYEGFGEDPHLCAKLGAAAVRGLQGARLGAPTAVVACAKHYVGDGGTSAMPDGENGEAIKLDQGDTRVDQAELFRVHLSPYPPAVEVGVATIMPSYSSWNGVKCSGSKYLLTDVLKEELGFEGFLISDYNAVDQIAPDYKEAIGVSINAGMDMVMTPSRYREFITLLTELIEEGAVPEERIDDAVRRILRVKAAAGLLDDDAQVLADRSLHEQFGAQEHRDVARSAVRKSLVLLKNQHDVLPLSKDAARIHVAGRAADDIGVQCGGWTIRWQGQAGPVTTGGTTILDAVRNAVDEDAQVTYSADGRGASDADVALVVVGEAPYAEGDGDDAHLALSEEDQQVIANAKSAGAPLVVVLISGRPMVMNDAIEAADALVAAWLPGTEGDGVADVLFGDHPPTGKLSFTWPQSADQHPINVGDEPYEPAFPYGFGLTY